MPPVAVPSQRKGAGEAAVSPMIGTMFVFVIIVMGMAGGMVFGVPSIKNLQDRASIDDMAAQLEQVREEAEKLTVDGAGAGISLAPNGGSLALEEGTKVAVAISFDSTATQQGLSLAWGKGGKKKAVAPEAIPCDFHVKDWADGDAFVTIVASHCDTPWLWDAANATEAAGTTTYTSTYTTSTRASNGNACPPPIQGTSECVTFTATSTSVSSSGSTRDANNKDACYTERDTACLQAFKVDGGSSSNRIVALCPDMSKNAGAQDDGCEGLPDDTYIAELDTELTGDWYFQMSNDPRAPATDTLLAKTYIFEMDKLRWVKDAGVTTWLEGGAVFGTRLDTDYVINDPIVDENFIERTTCAVDSSERVCQPTYYMRVIRFQGDHTSITANGNSVDTFLQHVGTQATANDGVSMLRLDFSGEGAELWCKAFAQRETPTGYAYIEHEDFPCDGGAGNDVRSVGYVYDPDCPATNPDSSEYNNWPSADDPDREKTTDCIKYKRDVRRYYSVVFAEVHFDVSLRP